MIARQPAHQSVDSTRFKGVKSQLKSQRVTTLFIALPDISRNAAGASFCRLMDGVVCQMRVAPATQLRPHRAHHLEGSRLIFQGLGNVLAQQIQCAAAIRAARLFGFQPLGFPGNVADSGPHVGRVEGSLEQVNRNSLFFDAKSILARTKNQRLSWQVNQWTLQEISYLDGASVVAEPPSHELRGHLQIQGFVNTGVRWQGTNMGIWIKPCNTKSGVSSLKVQSLSPL